MNTNSGKYTTRLTDTENDTCVSVADRLDALEGNLIHFDESMDLGIIGKEPSFIGAITSEETQQPKAKRLMSPSIFGTGSTECAFNIKGVVQQVSLLPYLSRTVPDHNKAKNSRQSITIGGYGSLAFADAYAGLWAIYDYMARDFREGVLKSPPQQFDISKLTIEASNLWLIERRKAPSAAHVQFTKIEDPNRVLETVAMGSFVRTSHNEVEYLAAGKDKTGNQTLQRTTPTRFNIGDIVEIQVNFVAFPVKRQSYTFETVLKKIIWIEAGKPSFFNIIQYRIGAFTKRKRIEGPGSDQTGERADEVNESTAKRFKDLHIDEEMVD